MEYKNPYSDSGDNLSEDIRLKTHMDKETNEIKNAERLARPDPKHSRLGEHIEMREKKW